MHPKRSLALNPHDYKRYTIIMCRHHGTALHWIPYNEPSQTPRYIHSRVDEEFSICSLLLNMLLAVGAAADAIASLVCAFLSLKNDFFGSSRHIAQNNNNICICIHICILYRKEQRQLRFIYISKTK